MEKEITKNRQATEMTLIKAVNDIIEESGFEGLGINAVAAKAKVSKILIYRYFNSLDGLIAAYIQQNDYWINFDEELPDQAHLAAFIKQIFKRQIMRLRENYTLKRLYRWELTTDNKFVKELRNKREEKGIWLVEAVSKTSEKRDCCYGFHHHRSHQLSGIARRKLPGLQRSQDSAGKRLGGIGRRHQSISRPLVTKTTLIK